ncbi:MAG: GIY-YIG nuclease family protein, partial [Bacteroidota bacterium]
MWYVYVTQSLKSGIHYVGMSQDVAQRIKHHNVGKSKFTRGHTPWQLIYQEEVGSTTEARKREKYLKSAAGERSLTKLLNGGSLPG